MHPFDKALAEGRAAARAREQQVLCDHSFRRDERLLLWRCMRCGAEMTDQQVYARREWDRTWPPPR